MSVAAAGSAPLTGVIPILVTPFDQDERIDLDALAAQLDLLVVAGVRAVGLGFGSEVQRLTPDEVDRIIRHVVAHTAGQLDVVGNADVTSVRGGVAAVRRLADAGAGFAMLRPSGLAGVTATEVHRALATVADEGGLPTVVQDAPQNTGVELSAQVLAELLTRESVAAIKVEPPASAPKISAIVAALDGAPGVILGGLGGIDLVHELDRGSAGTMPGPAFPEVFRAIHALHARGDRATAQDLLTRILPLLTLAARNMDAFLFQQKYLLQRRGVRQSTSLRSPHHPIDPHLASEVDALLVSIAFDRLLADARGHLA